MDGDAFQLNVNGSRGPVTPPDSDAHNNHETNNYDDEPDFAAQQEMRTPSPVDDEFELMEQNNAIVSEVSAQFVDSSQEIRSPSPPAMDSLPVVRKDPTEVLDDGEVLLSPEPEDEKRPKKRRHKDGEEKSGRKRRHSHASNEEKEKLKKLKEMSFGSTKSGAQDTRRFNFRETDATPEKKPVPKFERKEHTPLKSLINKERRDDSQAHYRAESITHPVMKTFREIKTLNLPMALDMLFSINPQDVAVLSKSEMVEVLDIMFELNRRREHLTINRMHLTDEIRKICNTEIALLNDLAHLMNGDERHFFEQLKQCPPSMDEIVPFEPRIAPTDVDLCRGTTRLHAVDLIPPPETPLIGRHDSNWESFLKHIPQQMKGVAPPPLNDHQQSFAPPLVQPNYPAPQIGAPPPSLASISVLAPPPHGSSASVVVQNPPPIVSSSANISQPPPNFQQPPPFSQQQVIAAQPPVSIAPATYSQPPPTSFQQPAPTTYNQPPQASFQQSAPVTYNQPPPNLIPAEVQPQFVQPPPGNFQQPPPGNFQQPAMVEMVQAEVPIGTIVQQQPQIEIIPAEVINVGAPSMSVPPPQIQIQQKPISSSMAQMDMSVPPPVFSMSSDIMRDQLSPVTLFRNSLKPSLLSSLVGPPPSLNEPPPTHHSSQPNMAFLHQPPPSISSTGSPQRFVTSMPPPNQSPQCPQPLMSVEVKNPFPDRQQRHGKSPYRTGDKQRRDNRNQKHQKNRGDRNRADRNRGNKKQPGNRGDQAGEEVRASESPASSISQTTTGATVASSSVAAEPTDREMEGGDGTPGSQ